MVKMSSHLGPRLPRLLSDHCTASAISVAQYGGRQVERGVVVLTQMAIPAHNLSMSDRSAAVSIYSGGGNQAAAIAELMDADRAAATSICIRRADERGPGSPAQPKASGERRAGRRLPVRPAVAWPLAPASSSAGSGRGIRCLRLLGIRVSGPAGEFRFETLKAAACATLRAEPGQLVCSGGDGLIASTC